jgi:hypothetical protein
VLGEGIMKALLSCTVLGMTLLMGTACGSPEPSCSAASAPLLKTIGNGGKAGAVTVSAGQSLESSDHKGVYLVAAKVTAPGAPEQVGVWATSNLDGEGAVYAVDSVAKSLTSFGDAAQTEMKISASEEGVGTVKGCL